MEVEIDSLHCDKRLTAETAALLAPQLREERAAVAAASAGRLPLPPFLAAGRGPHKHCRAAPRGPDRTPSLHRVALLTPSDGGGLAWAQDPAARAARRQHLRHRHLLQPSVVLGAADDSSSSGEAEAADITLVTQLSIDRLPALQQQCRSWAGPTAAVVYAPLVGGRLAGLAGADDASVAALEGGTPLDALEHVQQAYRSLSSLGGCRLTLELVVEERCDARLAGLWPINANRNRALLLAATPAVLLADVDFLVGGRLSPWLRAGAGSSAAQASAQQRRQLATASADGGTAAALAALAAAHAGSKNSSSDDAWLSGLLADAAAEGKGWLEAVLSQNAAVVLPAFEAVVAGTRGAAALTRAATLANAAAASDKSGLAGMAVGQAPTVTAFQQVGDMCSRGGSAVGCVKPLCRAALERSQTHAPPLFPPLQRRPSTSGGTAPRAPGGGCKQGSHMLSTTGRATSPFCSCLRAARPCTTSAFAATAGTSMSTRCTLCASWA